MISDYYNLANLSHVGKGSLSILSDRLQVQKDKISLSLCVKYSDVNRLSVRGKRAKNREETARKTVEERKLNDGEEVRMSLLRNKGLASAV